MRKLFTILIILCVAFAAYSMFSDDTADVKSNFTNVTETPSGQAPAYEIPLHRNMYKQLNQTQKDIYEQIRQTLVNGGLTLTFRNVNWDVYKEAIPVAYQAVYYDFPEFFWLNHAWEARAHQGNGGIDVDMEIDCYEYWDYTSDKNAYIDAAMSEAKKIASMAAALKTDYEKVKFVHDYLVVSAEYDYVCVEEQNKTVQRASSQQSHTIYGCLVNKVCVCDGYAKTLQLILSMLDVTCEYVQGDAGGGHAWNYVVIDGEEYWLDVTWDENEAEDENGNLLAPYGVNYGYFCVTDDRIYEKHNPEKNFSIPRCDSVTYNFFHHEKSYLTEYDFNDFCIALAEQSGAQILHVQFASHAELTKAMEDLFKNGRYKEIPDVGNRNITYGYPKTEEGAQILSLYLVA